MHSKGTVQDQYSLSMVNKTKKPPSRRSRYCPRVALGECPYSELGRYRPCKSRQRTNVRLVKTNPYAIQYSTIGDSRKGCTNRSEPKIVPISKASLKTVPQINNSKDEEEEERCNIPPFWYDRFAKIERKKLDYRLITQKQKAELSEEALLELQRRLKGLYNNSTHGCGDFSGMPLGDYGALAVISMLRRNTSVTSINLYNTQMGNDSVKRLAIALEKNNKICTVYLGGQIHQGSHSHNRIGDSGLGALATTIRKHPSLSILEIDLTHLTLLRSMCRSILEELR